MPHVDIIGINKLKIPSVTEILNIVAKPGLDIWRKGLCHLNENTCGFDEGHKIAEEAAAISNEIHAHVAYYLAGGVKVLETDNSWTGKLISKIKEMKIRKTLIEPEEVLVDEKSNLCGSPDFVGTDGNGVFIGDIKVKNTLDKLTPLQGCGYRYLINQKLGYQAIHKMLVLWAQKKSVKMIVKPIWYDLDEWQSTWESLIVIWNKLNPKRSITIL